MKRYELKMASLLSQARKKKYKADLTLTALKMKRILVQAEKTRANEIFIFPCEKN